MDKSPDAFRTISEVAEDLDLPQHVLRFWETRFSQIKPLKRGGGRRYYRPDDIDLLRGIRHLLYGEGYTIKGVQRILKEEGLRFVHSIGRGEETAPTRPASNPENCFDGKEGIEPANLVSGSDPRTRSSAGPSALVGVPCVEADGSGANRPGAELGAKDIACLKAAVSELLECQRVLTGLAMLNEPRGLDESPD